jgi:PilZ domain
MQMVVKFVTPRQTESSLALGSSTTFFNPAEAVPDFQNAVSKAGFPHEFSTPSRIKLASGIPGHYFVARGTILAKPIRPQSVSVPSRRLSTRVEAPGGVWVYWSCEGRDDVSPVRDVSVGGVFIETRKPREVGALTNLHFLCQEGQIRADATVRHADTGEGLGLKFTAVLEQDRPALLALMNRLKYFEAKGWASTG